MKGAPVARGHFVGDYEGLDHTGGTFLLDFGVATGTTQSPATEIRFATAS